MLNTSTGGMQLLQPDSPSLKQHLQSRQSSSSLHTCWTPCCTVARPQLSASCCHSASLLAQFILLGGTPLQITGGLKEKFHNQTKSCLKAGRQTAFRNKLFAIHA